MAVTATTFSQESSKRPKNEPHACDGVAYKPLTDEEPLGREDNDVSFVFLDGDNDVEQEMEEKEIMLRKWLATASPAPLDDIDEKENDETCCVSNIKVTGTCFCKIFVVLYLLACLLVSALYIAIYGPNELYLMPEVPPPYKPFKVSEI